MQVGAEAKPPAVDAGAQETDAVTAHTTEIIMRISAVVHVQSEDLREGRTHADFAKLRIEWITQTASGKNLDA